MYTANSRKTNEKYKELTSQVRKRKKSHTFSFKLEKVCHVITNQKKARVSKLILGKSRVQNKKNYQDKIRWVLHNEK